MVFAKVELGVEPAKYFSKSGEKKEPISELRFGDVFITSYRIPPLPETLEKCIALDVRESGSCDIHNIIVDKDGNEAVHPSGGSGHVSEIFEIVDNWSLERVIAACDAGWQLMFHDELPPHLKTLLRQESEKPPYKVSS